MDEGNIDGFITLDETVTESLPNTNDSLNNSKRKAGDDESDCIVESVNPRKKLCHSSTEDQQSLIDSQVLTVIFRSESDAQKYSKDITDFVSQLTKSDITTAAVKDGKPCLEFYKCDEEHPDKQEKALKPLGGRLAGSVDALPQYEQAFSGVIGVSSERKTDKSKPKNVCFNCEGDHMIAECPEPRDPTRIAKNRREHASKNPVYNRYHEEAEQKFGHLVPGRLSAGLREALGLRDGDLPLHTYRMRVQGYPPGWLRLARVQRSNISVHHQPTPGSGKDSDTATEKKEEQHYDLTKLISFPGFNVDGPGGFRDECKKKGFPEMQTYWSLQTMKKRLRSATARRPIHLKRPADLPTDNKDSTQDMEIVNDEDSREPGEVRAESDNSGDREGSPSLEALEEQRRALLNSLDTEEPEPKSEESQLVHAPPPAAAPPTPQAPVLTPGASRRRELGTPVAGGSRHIAYDAEKWSAGITEHIPYENLPGATGAWARMSGLMKRVRDHFTGKD